MAGFARFSLESATPDGATAPSSPSPPLRAPTTVRPEPLHPVPEAALVLQDTRSSASSIPVGAHGISIAVDPDDDHCHLPKRAPDQDAQAAREKLDRIARAQKKKRNWAKSTGVTVVSKALGRNDRRQRRRRHGISSDEDSSDSASTRERRSSADDDEVKLMITGNPVVSRVFDAAARTRDRFRGQTASPETSPQNEETPFRFSISRPGSALARRFRPASATPPPEAALKGSVTPSPAEVPSRGSMESPVAVPDRPRSRARPTLNPELLVVDEEGQSHQPTDVPQRGSSRRPALPTSNSFKSQTPISFGSSTPSGSGLSPATEQPGRVNDSASSLTGGPIHDEPQTHGPELPSSTSGSSVSSASSDDELDDSALDSDSDDVPDNMLRISRLSLEHGEELTKKQRKRRKKLVRREIRRRKANGEPVDDLIHMHGKAGQLGHKVSSRVSKGIHYASSQSRNRRAMDRYSPHPVSLQTADLPRSGSAHSATASRVLAPFTTITPSQSRGDNTIGHRRGSVATADSSRRSSMTVDDGELLEGDEGSTLHKLGTIDRSILSSRNSIRKYFHAPKALKRRRHKKWEDEMAALEQAGEAEARKPDPEAELDTMLAKFAQQQAPTEANKVKYEFDVLYENQRGLLVFGIPKFSPRTLFQWDPSPWTFPDGKRSPYNIANAQLPDPSWEWAYHEWFIDMTGDVDEAGWQYSGNFGRRFWPNVHFPHGRLGLPKTGVDGLREMNARHAEKARKRQAKESTKEDGGFEAIKRSAVARSSKWTGSPDAWTFVRRRRWIRLRRRKPLASATVASKPGEALPKPNKAASPAHEIPVSDLGGKSTLFPAQSGLKPGASDGEDEESPFGGSDESDFSSEDDETLYAPAYGRPSGFLPRRLPGNMSNGPDPAKSKNPRQRRRARQRAKEFTGTIRELKSLLPTIIALDREAKLHRSPTGLTASQSSYKWAMLKINKVDARNPFISWQFVKHRLQDEDMAFATTTLRAMERKYQQRQLAATQKGHEAAAGSTEGRSRMPIPSSFVVPSKSIRFDGLTHAHDGAHTGEAPISTSATCEPKETTANMGLKRFQEPFSVGPVDGHELTREALIEINFARVLRVLRACKLDRQRLSLWKLWLGVVSLEILMETARREDLAALGLLAPGEHGVDPTVPVTSSPGIDPPHPSGGSSYRYRQRAERAKARWKASVPMPDSSDVWDVLERKLDEVLLLFEFQSNRAQLIRLLLTVHESLHPEHMYKDRSLRANPIELSPAHVPGDVTRDVGSPQGVGGASGSRLCGWKRAGLPRLEFFSDLQRILAALPGNDATTNAQYIVAQPSSSEELELVAMPLGHHSSNPVIDKLEAEALSDSFLDHERIPSSSNAAHAPADEEELQRSTKGPGKELSATMPSEAGARWSRSPSPISRGPSVPLPYRHSPLSSIVPLSQGSLSSEPGSSLSVLGRPKTVPSARSTPASSAPPLLEENASRLEALAPHKPVERCTTLQPEREESSTTKQATDSMKSRSQSGADKEASQACSTTRPPIPVRSDSVSPQATPKDRS